MEVSLSMMVRSGSSVAKSPTTKSSVFEPLIARPAALPSAVNEGNQYGMLFVDGAVLDYPPYAACMRDEGESHFD